MNTKVSEVESKILDTNSLLTRTVFNTEISEVVNKISDHAKYIATQEFNCLTAEIFAARLTQGNLLTKIDFDNKIISFNRKITSNKTKYLEIPKEIK